MQTTYVNPGTQNLHLQAFLRSFPKMVESVFSPSKEAAEYLWDILPPIEHNFQY